MKLRITIHGRAYEVDVEVLDPGEGFPAGPLPKNIPGHMIHHPATNGLSDSLKNSASKHSQILQPAGSKGVVNSPIAGTILEIRCKAGDSIRANQEIMVIEAMKMETSIAAPTPGIVASIEVAVGDSVREGQTLIHLQ